MPRSIGGTAGRTAGRIAGKHPCNNWRLAAVLAIPASVLGSAATYEIDLAASINGLLVLPFFYLVR